MTATRQRFEAAFDDFRALFPAALCYTKIVPVDEVVTLTLFHREDEPLRRLILEDAQSAELDRLWDELHFVSEDALTLVDAYEQIWQFSTRMARTLRTETSDWSLFVSRSWKRRRISKSRRKPPSNLRRHADRVRGEGMAAATDRSRDRGIKKIRAPFDAA